ncbi:MAG: hypothetical protein LBJ46_10130 [Planctomycetota bacterium]|jgi:methionyl-tRNA formyltransferase|nr:hypothetical protein [Planctomycetota bacterium]
MRIFILGASETLWLTARHLHFSCGCTIVGVLTRKSSIHDGRTENDFKALADEFGAPFLLREELDAAASAMLAGSDADVCVAANWSGSMEVVATHFPLGVLTPTLGDPRRETGSDIDVWSILLGWQELNLSVFHVAQADGQTRVLPVSATMSLDSDATIADIRRFSESRIPALVSDAVDHMQKNGSPSMQPYEAAGAQRFYRLDARDRRIDWRQPAEWILAMIKAFTRPLPGAYTYVRDGEGRLVKLHVWRARKVAGQRNSHGPAGWIVHCRDDSGEAHVLTGSGVLALQSVSENSDSVWFEPGKAWKGERVRLGLDAEDEVFHLLEQRILAGPR